MKPRPGRRRRLLVVALALPALAGLDLARPPSRQVSTRSLLFAIHVYQATLSPLLPRAGVRCRFTPTCSRYAEGALAKHGALGGGLRALGRVARCGPWTPAGTYDPP
jgi:hypothetical protein